jgi:hypothetical protein
MSAAHASLGVHLWICPQARHRKGRRTSGSVSRTTMSVVRPFDTGRFVCGHYRWSKDFLEAGKKRLAGDTPRAETSDEVKDLRREAGALKEVVARLGNTWRTCKPPPSNCVSEQIVEMIPDSG